MGPEAWTSNLIQPWHQALNPKAWTLTPNAEHWTINLQLHTLNTGHSLQTLNTQPHTPNASAGEKSKKGHLQESAKCCIRTVQVQNPRLYLIFEILDSKW